jgi:CRISPR/Cas system Type II protein with McrA/HNH and RuvC-like nuclease domain
VLRQPYIVGVDIGTSSIAVCAFTYDESDPNRPKSLLGFDEYIFGEPIDPGDFVLSNAVRRTKRLMRRQWARKKARIQQILHLGELLGVNPASLAGNSLNRP